MSAGGAQFIFKVVAFVCKKHISSVYSNFPFNHRLASFPERHQDFKLKSWINP
jgi:hypothetical protein